jgi:hypothetical protein
MTIVPIKIKADVGFGFKETVDVLDLNKKKPEKKPENVDLGAI